MKNKHYIVAGIIAAGLAASGTAYAAVDTGTVKDHLQQRFGKGLTGNRVSLDAQLLGITEDEFRARVQNGEDPKNMLEAAGVTREDIAAARETGMRERLAQAVTAGKLTQAEADARITQMQAHKAKHEAVRVALDNNDFAAFQAAASGTPMETQVTAENFPKFAEAHRLMASGDRAGAKAIMDELGINPPHKGGHGGKGGGRHSMGNPNETN